MEKRKNIVIADDHSIIRQGLRQILELDGLYEITEAENGKQALEQILQLDPDVAILDIEMPVLTGYEVAQTIWKQGLDVDLIFLTMYKDETLFNKAMDIGVKGFVLKENTVSEIRECVQAVLGGRFYLSPAISELLIKRNEKLVAEPSDNSGLSRLSPTERIVLKRVSEMKTNQEIADALKVSTKTVQNHRNNICKKLSLTGSGALLKYAVENRERI